MILYSLYNKNNKFAGKNLSKSQLINLQLSSIQSPLGGGISFPKTNANGIVIDSSIIPNELCDNTGIQYSFWINLLGQNPNTGDGKSYSRILCNDRCLYFCFSSSSINQIRLNTYTNSQQVEHNYPFSYSFNKWMFFRFTLKNHICNLYINGSRIINNLNISYENKGIISAPYGYAAFYGLMDDICIKTMDSNLDPSIVPDYYLGGQYSIHESNNDVYEIQK